MLDFLKFLIKKVSYIKILKNSIIIPTRTPIKYKVTSIKTFSLKFLLFLNKSNKATPLPVNNPDIDVPKLITFSKYNCVNITLEPQLGINPISDPKNGPNIVFFINTLLIISLPIYKNKIFKQKLTIKINSKIFNVCLILDLIILCLQ